MSPEIDGLVAVIGRLGLSVRQLEGIVAEQQQQIAEQAQHIETLEAAAADKPKRGGQP